MRLGLKLFFGFFLIVGLAAFFVMRVFINEVKPGVRQAMEATLMDSANILAVIAADDVYNNTILEGNFSRYIAEAKQRDLKATVWNFPKRFIDDRITITNAEGIVIYDSEGRDVGKDYSRWNDVYLTLRGRYGARSSSETPYNHERTIMYVAAPIKYQNKLIGVLTLSQPNSAFEPFVIASQQNIIKKGVWLIGISGFIGMLITLWLTQGIGRLNEYAQAVSKGNPVPPPKFRNDEIGDLGRAIEIMRQKLEGKAYVEHYVQSLTHEMKSPLAAIIAAAELLQEPLPELEQQKFIYNINSQSQRLTQMIDKLLALAEVEQYGWLQHKETLLISDIFNDLERKYSTLIQKNNLQLTLVLSEKIKEITGDRFLLTQALSNFLENAIAFSPENSRIILESKIEKNTAFNDVPFSLLSGRKKAPEFYLYLQVKDYGEGIPDYALTRVFERFYSLPRPNNKPRSSGLGLSFVAEVARLHGGNAILENHPDGGTIAGMILPIL